LAKGIEEIWEWYLLAWGEMSDTTQEMGGSNDAAVRGEVKIADRRISTKQTLREHDGGTRFPKG
jgi:hypothetical protein